MKKIIGLICFICFSMFAQAQSATGHHDIDTTKKTTIVYAACGSCKFGLKGDCALAVKIGEKPYWVEGAKIDDYGDAHAADGMCNKVRKAEVSGNVNGEKYVVKSFRLLPEPEKTN